MAEHADPTRREDALRVVVSGDVTADWNLAAEPLKSRGEPAPAPGASWHRGGAALLADLVSGIAGRLNGTRAVALDGVDIPESRVHTLNQSYTLCARFPRRPGDRGAGTAWRTTSFLGVDPSPTDGAVRAEWQRLQEALPQADLVVLDDAALGFRDHSDEQLWQRTFADRRPWVVLKQARPVAEGPLWEHLTRVAPDRLVVILAVDDLRGREVQISRDLSWERTAQDLWWELVHKPRVNPLSRVAHTVVSFGAAGAVLVSGPGGGRETPCCTLYFDPQADEETWRVDHPGAVVGTADTLAAALTREILLEPDTPDLPHGIQVGTAAARRLQVEGYQERGSGRMGLGFPLSSVVEELERDSTPLQETAVSDPAVSDRYWTILEDRCTGNLAAKAAEIVLHGPESALAGVPLGRFGNLLTADRSEIEAFRSVGGLIGEYVGTPRSKPLSIGVFGPPGAGKSFGVKEVARAIGGNQVDKPLEFNLSQLRGPDDLVDALHLVRDRALSGVIPLVFWDEFDTSLGGQPYGWLRYFLAPMQDGEFRQGQLTHPVGRSIFVFAGGTSARLEDFAESVHDQAGRLAKGPDFVSRLKGFVNILGPNPQGAADPFHVVRRAILLRSMLSRGARALLDGGELHIDPGVLRAFLEVREFRHGARSMEAIIAMSTLTGKSVYERSCLPAEPQLNLHVDAEDFLALVQRPDLEGDLLERLARAAHDVYREGLAGRETLTDAERDSLHPYDDLADYKKQENVGSVCDIPAKLALVGCVMVPGRADLPQARLTDEEVEILAEAEHERWMRGLGPGWSYGSTTDTQRKVQADYLPWPELPESEKDKDRNLVRRIPVILHRAGYAVVRTG